MLKNILNVNGAQELSKNEQKSITGGNLTQSECEGLGGTWNCVIQHPFYIEICHCSGISGGGGDPFIPKK